MGQISFVWVLVIAIAVCCSSSVLGQEDWMNMLGQGGFSEDALNKAQMALGSATAQAAVNDYLAGGVADDSDSPPLDGLGLGSSLADFLDRDSATSDSEVSPTESTVDSPVGAPEDLPVDHEDDSFSPAGAPPGEAPSATTAEAPYQSEEEEAEAPDNWAPTGDEEDDDDEKEPPAGAPTGEPDDDDEFEDVFGSAPATAPTPDAAPPPADQYGDHDDLI